VPTLAAPPPPPPPPAVVSIAPPPPSSSSSGTSESSSSNPPPGGLASVTALDPSGNALPLPAGNASGKPPEAVADVQPVKAATQAQARVPTTSQALGGFGSNLFQAKAFTPRPRGVPGVSQ